MFSGSFIYMCKIKETLSLDSIVLVLVTVIVNKEHFLLGMFLLVRVTLTLVVLYREHVVFKKENVNT